MSMALRSRRASSAIITSPASMCYAVDMSMLLGESAAQRKRKQNVGIPKLISTIDSQRQNNNLSSAIRVYVLSY